MNKKSKEKKLSLCQIDMEIQHIWENNMLVFLTFPKSIIKTTNTYFYIHLKCVVEKNILGKDCLTIIKGR